jgi:NADH:ubiquinone oxidoreductase subunit 6 (subunit J)
VVLAWAIVQEPALWQAAPVSGEVLDGLGSVEGVGEVLFRRYGLHFELVSVLIIVAMFGAMVLAKKRIPG